MIRPVISEWPRVTLDWKLSARTVVSSNEGGNSAQFELNSFDDAVKVLNEGINSYVPDALLFLRDIQEELNMNQIQELLATFNNYIESTSPPNQVMSTILDILITIFSEEDLESINRRELIRNVSLVHEGCDARVQESRLPRQIPQKNQEV
jgi:hypothetical protein